MKVWWTKEWMALLSTSILSAASPITISTGVTLILKTALTWAYMPSVLHWNTKSLYWYSWVLPPGIFSSFLSPLLNSELLKDSVCLINLYNFLSIWQECRNAVINGNPPETVEYFILKISLFCSTISCREIGMWQKVWWGSVGSRWCPTVQALGMQFSVANLMLIFQ